MKNSKALNRRGFLKSSTLGALGVGIAARSGQASPSPVGADPRGCAQEKAFPKIKAYRTLGRTGFEVSDIGAGSITDEGVLGTALDAGVNYIDTAEQYPGHHKVVAKVLKGRDRKKIFVSTKLELKPEEDNSKAKILARARKALKELDTEYVDCLMIHMAETAATLKTPGFHEAVAELKAEGRVKHAGVSNHGSFWFQDPAETMDKVLLAAADDGRFDVILLAYNFLRMDGAEKVLETCKRKGIGTALMKHTPIAIYYSLKSRVEEMEKKGEKVHPLYKSGLERYKGKLERAEGFINKYNLQKPEEIRDAAIRFVLDNPNVGTVCCLARTYDDLERFVALSGSTLGRGDKARLAAYREGCGELYCRHACGVCEPSCPHGVPVNTILRYHHYLAQGRERDAIMKYAAIPGTNASVCAECPGYCEQACPHGVSAQGMLLVAHEQLCAV